MPNFFWEQFPKVFEAAIKTPLAIFAVLSCILALIAWLFFRKGRTGAKTSAFVLLFLGVCALGYATFDSAKKLHLAAQTCLNASVAKFRDRRLVSVQNQVRCSGGGVLGLGERRNGVVALSAPPEYAVVGPPEIKNIEQSRGSQGELQSVLKNGLTVGILLPIRCESPSQAFGPAAWMGATLEATVERQISQAQRAELSRLCGLTK